MLRSSIPAVSLPSGGELPYRTTTMTAPEQCTFAKAREHIADGKDALCSLEESLYALERGRYVANGADYTRWMLDDLEEAVHGLREFLAARSA